MSTERRSDNLTLPNLLIVGAQKSGTTSLATYIGEHPDVMMPRHPVYFFNRYFDRGLEWYSTHFESASSVAIIGEGTPEYMYHPEIAARIADSLPNVRLIAILRDPIDRAYSHYWHNQTRGHEALSFSDAVAAEPSRLKESDPATRARFAYVDRGRYVGQLENLCRYVPRERVKVLIFEEMRADPVTVTREAFEFLGIDHTFVPKNIGQVRNRFVSFRSQRLRRSIRRLPGIARIVARRLNVRHESYPPMEASVRADLVRTFAPGIESLEKWLRRDLAVWTHAEADLSGTKLCT